MPFSMPGLAQDIVTVTRVASSPTADSDGEWTTALSQVYYGQGTYGRPSARDREIAAQRDQVIDAVLALPFGTDVRTADKVTCRGRTWVAVTVDDVRLITRVGLRAAG